MSDGKFELMTASRLVQMVQSMIDTQPEVGSWPVHMLDMDNDGSGLVTTIEIDCFEHEGPWVVSLVAEYPQAD